MPQPTEILRREREYQEMLAKAQARILDAQAAVVDPVLGGRKLGRLDSLLGAVATERRNIIESTEWWLDNNIEAIYELGPQISGLGAEFAWNQIHREAVDEIMSFHYDEILAATDNMDIVSKTWFRNAARWADERSAIDGMTRVEQARFLKRRAIERGLLDPNGGPSQLRTVTYANGSKHTFDEYAGMLTRTTTALTYNRGTLNTMEQLGIGYVEVFDGSDCGASSHDDPDKVNATIRTVKWAQQHQIAHPNCRRSFGARPDIPNDEDAAAAEPLQTPELAAARAKAERAQNQAKQPAASRRQPRQPRSARTPRQALRQPSYADMGPEPTGMSMANRRFMHQQFEDRALMALPQADKRVAVLNSGQYRNWEQMIDKDIVGRQRLMKHATMRNIQRNVPDEVLDRLGDHFISNSTVNDWQSWLNMGNHLGWRPESGELVQMGKALNLLDTVVDLDDIAQLRRNTTVSQMIHEWAVTSNDSNPFSLAFQEVIEREFGLAKTAGSTAFTMNNPGVTAAAVRDLVDRYGDDLGVVARAIYDDTQAALEATVRYRPKHASIPLYRGIKVDDPRAMEWFQIDERQLQADHLNHPEIPGRPRRGVAQFTLRPLSSFSSSTATANSFGDYVLAADVPTERIFSMPGFGQGCYGESEFVLLGAGQPERWYTVRP